MSMTDVDGLLAGDELKWLEYRLASAPENEKPRMFRFIQAYKRHQKDCAKPDLVETDPFGVVYKCVTCGQTVHSSRYLVSGVSVTGRHRGKLRAGTEVLDTMTGVWHKVGKDHTIPHDNRCIRCGQDMSPVNPELAAERFDPKAPVG